MVRTWHYYDLLLAGIAVSVGAGALVGYATALSMPASVAVFGGVAMVLMGHGLFVNGPVDDPEDLTDEVDTLN